MRMPTLRLMVVLLPLALGGCSGALVLQVLGGLAATSTLLKNEANCSLAAVADCTLPHLVAPTPSTTKP